MKKMMGSKDKRLFAGVLLGICFTMTLITFPRKIGLNTRTSSGNENHNTIPSNVHRYSTLKCDAKFKSSLEDNLKHIRATNFSAALPYMEKFRLNESPLSTTFSSHVTVPVFVTACSSNHFFETLGLLKNIEGTVRPVYKDLKIIIYNLGLEEEEIIQLSEACNCTIRKFPFVSAPPHFKILRGCPWKPIVIQMVLQEYPFVMWMDSSMRFITGLLQPMFDKAKDSGIVLMFRNSSSALVEHTHQELFQFLNEPPCLYNAPEMCSCFIVIYAKDIILEGIMNPWVKCSLIQECLVTTRPFKELIHCPEKRNIIYHKCHRYDQSVLGIFVYRLFHDEMDRHLYKECEYVYHRNNTRCPGYSADFWIHH